MQLSLWTVTFFVAAAGTGAAHLTVSEIFPSHLRCQCMAVFFSLSMLMGGVAAPPFYAYIIQTGDSQQLILAYLLTATLMLYASIVSYCYAINAENRSLEEITYTSHSSQLD